jgi:hypothetical protein
MGTVRLSIVKTGVNTADRSGSLLARRRTVSRFGETCESSRWLTVAGGRSGMESSDLAGASGETKVIADSVPDYPFVVGSQAMVGGTLGLSGIQL